MKLVLILVLFLSAPVAAEQTPFRWDTHTKVPEVISNVGVYSALGVDIYRSLWSERHDSGWQRLACRSAFTLAATEIPKLLIHRWRPDHSDQKSFPSAHSAWAAQSALGIQGWGLAMTVGWGRAAAGKHYGSDVAAGFAIGAVAREVCDRQW